ncbi:ankyrin repeat domain-containing protein [bacterium]|nr:ankyrin repeat domain-containing protein [bacterium]
MKTAKHLLLIFLTTSLGVSSTFSLTGFGLPPSEDPLVKACEQKDIKIVDDLLSKGANPKVVDKASGHTPLIAASLAGSIEIVRSLLKAGADVDQVDHNGENALMVALGSNEDVALLLILWGADIKHKSHGSVTTAFLIAAGTGRNRAMNILKEKGANINERGWANRTAVHWAALAESPANIPALLDWGLDINAQDDDGMTPLMYAVQYNATQPGIRTTGKLPPLETVDLLLEKGADCSIKNKDGKTVHDLAKEATGSEVIKLIETRCKA